MSHSTASKSAQIIPMATIPQDSAYLIAQMDGSVVIIQEHAYKPAL